MRQARRTGAPLTQAAVTLAYLLQMVAMNKPQRLSKGNTLQNIDLAKASLFICDGLFSEVNWPQKCLTLYSSNWLIALNISLPGNLHKTFKMVVNSRDVVHGAQFERESKTS